jgi:uncharacterized protein
MNRRIRLPRIDSTPFTEIVRSRFSRREMLAGATALSATALLGCGGSHGTRAGNRLRFSSIASSGEDTVRLADGYAHDVLLRWGDPIYPGAPQLSSREVLRGALLAPSAAADQARQFGYNCDAVHFFALAGARDRGMLAVNHEYTNDELMYPGLAGSVASGFDRRVDFIAEHPQVVAYNLAAQGVSVVEIVRQRGKWRAVSTSSRNRRITGTTPIEISGPAARADLLRTAADASGRLVLGTLGNCAGGRTPWGTYLTAEENVYDYFGNAEAMFQSQAVDPRVKLAHRRFRFHSRGSLYGWEGADPRFDLARHANEVFRYGWIVEIDPFNPQARPKKRTALGRFCHEAATTALTRDQRAAVYMGDDERFEYLYKFVSRDRFDPRNPASGRDLLDHGTLYAARLDANGKGEWLPLVHETGGPLDDAVLFRNQADVVINARAAADRRGATPMDRPEDIEVHPQTGRVYIACTKNQDRRAAPEKREFLGREIDLGVNAANPRPDNKWGHIVEIIEHGDDAGSLSFDWNIFLLAGDPARGRVLARYEELTNGNLSADDVYMTGQAIGSPDNLAFDPSGNLWIVTDGDQPQGGNNGCFACATEGAARSELKRFMTGPVGAEICGCSFTPDGETLFLAIQHPGEGGSLEHPISLWPDGPGCAVRPSLIAVRREDGEPI